MGGSKEVSQGSRLGSKERSSRRPSKALTLNQSLENVKNFTAEMYQEALVMMGIDGATARSHYRADEGEWQKTSETPIRWQLVMKDVVENDATTTSANPSSSSQ